MLYSHRFLAIVQENEKKNYRTKKNKRKRVEESVFRLCHRVGKCMRERVWGGGTNCVKNNDFVNKDVMDLTFLTFVCVFTQRTKGIFSQKRRVLPWNCSFVVSLALRQAVLSGGGGRVMHNKRYRPFYVDHRGRNGVVKVARCSYRAIYRKWPCSWKNRPVLLLIRLTQRNTVFDFRHVDDFSKFSLRALSSQYTQHFTLATFTSSLSTRGVAPSYTWPRDPVYFTDTHRFFPLIPNFLFYFIYSRKL